jgi:hypothetical protein
MNVFARLIRVSLVVVLAWASPVAFAHDEDDGHEHAHGPVVQPRNFDHAVDLVREGLERLGAAVQRGDMHALHELSDGVVVPARAFGKLAAAWPGAAPANIRAINTLGQDIATLVDAMHFAADSSKADVVVAKWKEIETLVPQLDAVSPRFTLDLETAGFPETAGNAVVEASLKQSGTGPVTAYEPEGGHSMHLYVVSADLRFFKHAAADTHDNGTFKFEFAKDSSTRHTFFVLSRPAGRVEPIVLQSGDLELLNAVVPQPVVVKPDTEPSKAIDGYLVRLKGHDHIHAGEAVTLTYMIDENAKPGGVATEELFGGLAHFVAIDSNRKKLVSAAKMERGSTGEIRVETAFPEGGVYGTWLEFKHAGKVVTVPFVIEVH